MIEKALKLKMSNVVSALQIYRENGLNHLVKVAGAYVLLSGPFAPSLKSILGERLHQKSLMYFFLGYWPHIRHPRSFNEKIMHRKLYSDNDMFAVVEDKWRVREYVAENIGAWVLPEVYHVTDDPDTIPFDDLPDVFVVKPNHLEGSRNLIINGTDDPGKDHIRTRCWKWLNSTHGQIQGEYWYRDIEPRIMIEELIQSEGNPVPIDYKFLVFHGDVEVVHVTQHRFKERQTVRNFYDAEWNSLDVQHNFPRGNGREKPENLDEMIEVAETLGKDFDHIRVDLYSPADKSVVFGEMTVAESSGGMPFVPRKYDFELGSYW